MNKLISSARSYYGTLLQPLGRLFVKCHHKTTKKLHQSLLKRFEFYARWWGWQYHRHFHIAGGVLAFLVVATVTAFQLHAVFALSAWTQNDWSGGVGSSTVNQYSAGSNVNTATAGQVTLNGTGGWGSSYAAWKYREAITFNNTQTNLGVAPDTLTNFPVLVQLTSANFNFSQAQSGGQDIRFTQLDGNTALNYEIESWSSTNQVADIWVNVPSITAGSTTTGIDMYWGNSSASDGQNKTAAWNSGYAGVWHLDETSGNNSDSTANNRTGTIQGSPSRITGQINGAMNYTGPSDIDAISSVNLNGLSYAIEGWFQFPLVASSSGWKTLVRGSNDHQLLVSSSGQLGSYDNSTGKAFVNSGYTISGLTTGWHYIAVVGNNSTNTSTFYIDGLAVGSPIAWKSNNDIEYFGNYQGGSQNWGPLDEFRLSTTLRDAAWVAASYATEAGHFDSYASPQTQYSNSGTLVSAIYNGNVENNWGQLSFNATTPAGTTVSVAVRSGNQTNLSDAPAFSTCPAITSGSDVTGTCAPGKTQYAQYQVTLTGNGTATPTLTNISITYSPSDTTPPTTNASSVLMYHSNGGASVANNGWTNTNPYFSWTAGADNVGGSGILGYCLYLGQDPTGNPITTKGDLGTSPVNSNGACQFAVSGTSVDLSQSGYMGTALTSSTSPYYLNVVAIDNADNVYTGSPAQFQFRYDNVAPTNPSYVSAPSQFVSNKQVVLTWPITGSGTPADDNSGVAGLQYRIGASGTWYGTNHSGTQDCTDLLPNSGSYTTASSPDFANLVEGDNIVYFRTWDNACNVSAVYVTTVIKINTTAPSSPQNLTATPTTNTANSFAFSWLPPATYQGSVSNMTYCYSVNTLPTDANCTFTGPGTISLDAGAYATEPGDNTMYVVAKDEAGNINYSTYAYTTFTANTPAPGVPLNLDIADISVKVSSLWKLALSWEQPSTVGAGIATYRVYRSTDGVNYANVASTAGTSYVDTNLNQETYYYKIKACDSANNCGIFTNPVSLYPTGKYTSPANLISGPNFSVTTRSATITWTTDRDSNSQVEYGLSSGNYFPTAASNLDQSTTHDIVLNNLAAGTTYYYRALWTDADGNTGTSYEGKLATLPSPTVNNVTVSNVNLHNATINFTTSGATAVKLYYGPNGSLNNTQILNTSTSISSYSMPLTNLSDGTDYTYRLDPFDVSSYEYTNPTSFSFSTPPAPAITNVQFQPVPGALTGTEQVSWTTNVPATSQISYAQQSQALSSGVEAIDTTMTTSHTMTIASLNYNTPYQLVATAQDALGNTTKSDLQVFHTGLDTRPPIVSGLTIQPSIRGTGASASGQIIVSWKTDKAGSSQVAYGSGSSGGYSSKTAQDTTMVTNHVVVISNLPTSQVFHLQALSVDEAGNVGVSANQTTIVGQATDSALSIIFNSLQSVFGL
jgi:hypothetical protein